MSKTAGLFPPEQAASNKLYSSGSAIHAIRKARRLLYEHRVRFVWIRNLRSLISNGQEGMYLTFSRTSEMRTDKENYLINLLKVYAHFELITHELTPQIGPRSQLVASVVCLSKGQSLANWQHSREGRWDEPVG